MRLTARSRRWAGLLARLTISIGLLLALGSYLDVEGIVERLRGMDARWVALALIVAMLQVAVSAWRWQFTAARLGMRLPLGVAVREYAIGTFLNQVLPGGVMGDLSRAWRHGRTLAPGRAGQAVRAVVLERASGQIVMLACAGASIVWLTWPGDVAVQAWVAGVLVLAVGLLSAAASAGLRRARASSRPSTPPESATSDRSVLGRTWLDTRAALLSPGALPAQLASSVLVVGSYLVTYLIAARAVGIDTPATTLLPLVAPVLVAMLIPATIAGWGMRDTGAALLWSAASLPAADGVAISVAYGLVVLASSLPGAALLLAGAQTRVS